MQVSDFPLPALAAGLHRSAAILRATATLCAATILCTATAFAQSQADPEAGRAAGATRTATAPQAMVATANAHATRAGVAILRAGGNAVDAAAAAQFVLNVVEPQSSGIGGGGFMLIYLAASGRVVSIDGREEAPEAATPDMFLEPGGAPQKFYPRRITGGNAVGVPGLVMALEKAVSRFGRLSLARVLAPAIRLAETGFPVSPRLAASLARHRERLARFPATRRLFFTASGDTLAEGARLMQPELAATLRLLGEGGSAVFYRGEIAADVVRAVRQSPVNPGRLVAADLAGYDAPLRQPVRGSYGAFTLYGMGPPSSGGITVIQIMQLLEAAPPPGRKAQSAAAGLHRFAQAVRLAYADRARYLADADFFDVPAAGLLDVAYARRRAGAIDWDGPLAPVEAGLPPGVARLPGRGAHRERPSTTHLSVVDAERNMVALTSSVEQAFGSGMVVPGRGFLLNNQLTDFSARPTDKQGRPIANRAQGGRRPRRTALDGAGAMGGKRPRSSMAPTFVFRGGKPLLALGSPGGSRIIQYVARVLLDVLEGRRTLAAAIAAPHATHFAGRTFLEPGPGPAATLSKTVAELERLGHKVRIREQNSGLHGIWIDPATGRLHGAADPRREGTVAGF
jgi:gamma-glutamyltranspeptidase/glutathione hydrolase